MQKKDKIYIKVVKNAQKIIHLKEKSVGDKEGQKGLRGENRREI